MPSEPVSAISGTGSRTTAVNNTRPGATLPLPPRPVKPLASGAIGRLAGHIGGRDGSLPSATYKRDHARLNLWPDRHRLHHGLRHYRHGELRPWRRLHG